MASVELIRAHERKRAIAQTPGMTREEAFAGANWWSGEVVTAPGMISGWHHHDDYDTVIYVLSGALRIESGVGGRDTVDGKAGDFVLVPGRTIHRESNPSEEEAHLVAFRVGSGQIVVNVDGPAAKE